MTRPPSDGVCALVPSVMAKQGMENDQALQKKQQEQEEH